MKYTKYPKMNNDPKIGLSKVIFYVSKPLIANDEKTNTLGIKQKSRPFHNPRKLLLIDLSFSYLNIAPPTLNIIVINKNMTTTVIYPLRL